MDFFPLSFADSGLGEIYASLEMWKFDSMQPQVSPDFNLQPVTSSSRNICAVTYEWVYHNLPPNEGINLGIDSLSAEEHCRLSYIRYFAVMLLTGREK